MYQLIQPILAIRSAQVSGLYVTTQSGWLAADSVGSASATNFIRGNQRGQHGPSFEGDMFAHPAWAFA